MGKLFPVGCLTRPVFDALFSAGSHAGISNNFPSTSRNGADTAGNRPAPGAIARSLDPSRQHPGQLQNPLGDRPSISGSYTSTSGDCTDPSGNRPDTSGNFPDASGNCPGTSGNCQNTSGFQ